MDSNSHHRTVVGRGEPGRTTLSAQQLAFIDQSLDRITSEDGFFDDKHRVLTEFGLRWMLEIDLYPGQEETLPVKALTAASFVVCCAPDGTTIEQDKVATQWDTLLFLANDMELPELREFYAGLDDVYAGGAGNEHHRIFRYWLPELERRWAPDLLARFKVSWKTLTAAFIDRKTEGNGVGLLRYDQTRLINIAVDNWVDTWCAILDLRIGPEAEFELHDLQRWCDRLVYICNDLGSLERDLTKQERGESYDANIVMVEHEATGRSIEDSIEWAVSYHNDLAIEFDRRYRAATRKYGGNESVMTYLSFIEQIIPGHFEVIYRHSYRYDGQATLRRLVMPQCCQGRTLKL